VNLRPATPGDAASLWRLIGRVGGLERNSCYAYVLLCSDFGDTSMVAEQDGQLVGFVLGYRPPRRPEEMFVWQVGVAPELRGAGLAQRLLEALLAVPACSGVRYLTATVSPDNGASRSLFRGFARRRAVPFEVGPGFAADLFATPHEPEELVRIGPLGSPITPAKVES
jgi:L-2,4-diaminobutyric acid acetyltransferase